MGRGEGSARGSKGCEASHIRALLYHRNKSAAPIEISCSFNGVLVVLLFLYLFSSELRRSEPTIIYDHPKPEYLFFAYRVMNSFNVGKQLRDRSSESRHSQHPIL